MQNLVLYWALKAIFCCKPLHCDTYTIAIRFYVARCKKITIHSSCQICGSISFYTALHICKIKDHGYIITNKKRPIRSRLSFGGLSGRFMGKLRIGIHCNQDIVISIL